MAAEESSDEGTFYDAEASDDEMQLAAAPDVPATRPPAQLMDPPPVSLITPFTSTTTSPRPSTADGTRTERLQHRHSLHEGIPAIPPIPARFLGSGRPATITTSSPASPSSERSRTARRRDAEIEPSPGIRVERPRTAGGDGSTAKVKRALSHKPTLAPYHQNDSNGRLTSNGHRREAQIYGSNDGPLLPPIKARRKSLPSLARPQVHGQTLAKLESSSETEKKKAMARRGHNGRDGDLFLELAEDADDTVRPQSRLSLAVKRRSLPADPPSASSAERRPKSSGNFFSGRPSERNSGTQVSDLQRHMDRYRSASRSARFNNEDTASLSGRSIVGRARQYSAAQERSPMSADITQRIMSPELPSYGRRRPSFGAEQTQALKGRQSQLSGKTQESQEESPEESSEAKRSVPGSESVASSTADTVWDELDDLKTRIKKLEHTGKLPLAASSGAASGETSERPRTATTAPTTIDSSPKRERKASEPEKKSAAPETNVGGPNASTIHPMLHSALAKAKPLLNATLYRSLEATASDALQLAALTGSAGPQGTTFSAASIINGVTVSDRHVRRKADTMCRNLTDLCLALCEGKHEAPNMTASPISMEPVRSSPTLRYSRSSIGASESVPRLNARPMSRLEARRTSILGGMQRSTSIEGSSRHDSADDISASEPEGTPTHPPEQPRHVGRASSRLLSVRPSPRYDDVSGDDDPTIRPPSRAATEIGAKLRWKPMEYHSPSTPGLRETMAARRVNSGAYETNGKRVASDVGRRRWTKESTPPVVEEEVEEYQSSVQPRRRITSLGQFSSRRAEGPSRTTSLSSRRRVAVE